MELSAFAQQILFVIVLYKRKPERSPAFNALLKLSGVTIFVYDNSPASSLINDSRIIYRHAPENPGVSKAYNEGSRFALGSNKKWMILFDQDTACDLKFIQKLQEATLRHAESPAFVPYLKDLKGIVSPFGWSMGKGTRINDTAEKLPLDKFRFANSGLLIRLDAFHAAGGYDESIPLDFSDIAFGEKLRKITDHFIVVNTTLPHSFSGSSPLQGNEVAERFHYFCKGALGMGRAFGNFNLYTIRAFMRAVHLMLIYRKSDFIKIFFQSVRNS